MDKAYFPYGTKSKEFLLKRTLYLCLYLQNKVDKIILACNTISLITLPFLRMFFSNITGVFNDFIPYINDDTAIIGSSNTVKILKGIYPHLLYIDGSKLISKIENNIDYDDEIEYINNLIINNSNLILACTHFIKLEDNSFKIEAVKNKTD